MADPDLIACLYPFGANCDRASDAIKSKANRSRYVGPPLSPSLPPAEDQYSRHERQQTEEPEEHNHLDYPHLELRFSHGPQTPYGFVFGFDKNSDVVLRGMPGISSHHFALTFDEEYRPIVKDLGSLCGTEVTYNEEGAGRRRDFRWIVGGHRVPNKKTPIVIEVVKDLKFQIVVSHHDMNTQLYIDSVNRFRQGTADTENLFGRLDLPPETERPTGTHTPGTGPIFLRKKLGEGGFGVVTHFWNVSTGEEYALKQPSLRAIRDNDIDASAWSREADIMGQITHEHIVRLIAAKYDPWPMLYLEYVPGGSLHDQEYISVEECVQILRQLLSALAYLHGRNPSIVHRDIKSENILVQYRNFGDIHVKFGDFGLSRERRESGNWKTVCGTWNYAAPEMLEKKRYVRSGGRERKRYTAAVDIWSLGVVAFELLCGLPRYKEEYRDEGAFWCEKIIKKLREDLRKRPEEVLQFLSTTMLIMEPELRGSAQECYDGTLLLSRAAETIAHTPTPAPYIQDQQATPRPVAHYGHEGPQTAFQDPDWPEDDPIDSAEIQRYIRSDNPSPPTHGKRAMRVSGSALSEAKRTRLSRHSSLTAEPNADVQGEYNAEMEHFYQDVNQDPLNSLYVGSSLAALERELPQSWDRPSESSLPRSLPGFKPHLVEGGAGYVQHRDLVSTIQGRADGGRSWQNEGHTVEHAYEDEQEIAAALLLAMKGDECRF